MEKEELKEYFLSNNKKVILASDVKEKIDTYVDLTQPYIKGPETVYPYDVVTYYIKNAEGGEFIAEGSGFEIASQDAEHIKLGIVTGKSGSFTLKYKRLDKEDIVLPITIGSL